MTVAGYQFHANGAAWAVIALLAVLFAVVMVAIARRSR